MNSVTPAAMTGPGSPRRGYAFDEYVIDLGASRLLRGATTVPLPSRAFDALVYLVEHRDRLVGKEELISAIWHDVAVTDDSLIHAVSVLRRAFGDEYNDPRFIETIPRRGYRFVASVTLIGGEQTATVEGDRAGVSADPGADLAPRGPDRSVRRAAVPALLAAGIAAAAVLASLSRGPLPTPAGQPSPSVLIDAAPLRFDQPPPPGTRIVSGGALSPDRRYLAFVARSDTTGTSAIWVRAFASGTLQRLDGTESAAQPFWSPDSRRIGFFAEGSLKTTGLAAETPQTLARIGLNAAGGSWGPDGTILFAVWSEGLYTIPANGGAAPTAILELDRAADDIAISRPQFLPDGRHMLYHVASLDTTRNGTYVSDLQSEAATRLLATQAPAIFAPPRHLLHVAGEMLIAEEFDPERREITGRASVVARGVSPPSLLAYDFASAAGDLLAFQAGIRTQNLAWFDRSGRATGHIATPAVLYNPRLSPDGLHVLATSSITNDPGLWVTRLDREEFARIEQDAIAPLWSPDGQRMAFTAHGGSELIVRTAVQTGERILLASDATARILNDWAPAGEDIIFTRSGSQTRLDLWTVAIASGRERPLIASDHNEMQARISPDGEWIAYASDETGALEVYVDRYPGLGSRRLVSAAGGGQPQWRADRRELFYISADRELMAIDVRSGPDATVVFDAPRPLFRAPVSSDPASARDHYAVAVDGSRFLFDSAQHGGNNAAITVIANWISTSGPIGFESSHVYEAGSPLPH